MRNVWFVTRSFFAAGGMEEVFTMLALQLHRRGVRVHVFLRDPVPNENPYLLRLRGASVPVTQPPSWVAVDRLVRGLTALSVPLLLVVAAARSLLRRQPLGDNLASAHGRAQAVLAGLLHRDFLPQILDLHLLLDRPDVVHTHHADAAWAIAWCARRRLPCVHSEHSTPSADGADWDVLRATAGQAAFLTAVSKASAEALRRVCRTAGTVIVLGQPVEDPCGGAVDGSGMAADRPPTILCVARLSHEKGVADLVRAMPHIVTAVPGCRLNVAGDGAERSELEALAEVLGVGDMISFLGHVPRSSLIEQLLSSTVFALPSRLEGKPISVIEAMACGLPVVATAVGGTPELVDDGVTGTLVPPGDPIAMAQALIELLRAPERRADMGAAARRRFEQGGYSPDAVVDMLLEVYGAAIGRGAPRLATLEGSA